MPTKEERQAAREARQAAREAKKKDTLVPQGSTDAESSIPLFDENKVNAKTMKDAEKPGDLVTQTYDGSGKAPVVTVTKQGESEVQPSSKLSAIVSNQAKVEELKTDADKPSASNAVLEEISKAKTFEEAKNLTTVAESVNSEEEKAKNQILNKTEQELKLEQEKVAADEAQGKTNTVSSIISNEPLGTATSTMNTSSIGGDGSMVSGVMAGAEGNRDSYESTANKEDVKSDIVDANLDAMSGAPKYAIEKLGVSDYYPEAGRDIGVGTFTGSRIGSQTIYSGAGGLLPMGLYDARKRALVTAAKEKQAALDKYFNMPDAAPQFNIKFKEAGFNEMNALLMGKHKGNIDKFLADGEVRKRFAKLEAIGKETTHYSAWATKILEDAKDDKKYVTKEMIDTAGNILNAQLTDTDGIVSGKTSLSKYFDEAKTYVNGFPVVDALAKELLDPNRMGQLPINLKTGGEFDAPLFKQQAQEFLEKVGTGNIDYTTYVTGMKTFFTGDYEKVIDSWVTGNNASEDQRELLKDHFFGMLQERVKLDYKDLSTNALGRAQLAEKAREFNANMEQRKLEGKGHWETANQTINEIVDSKTKKGIHASLLDLKRKNLSPEQFKAESLDLYRRNGIANARWDYASGAVVVAEDASPNEIKNRYRVTADETTVVLQELFRDKNGKTKKGKDGNNIYVQKSVPMRTFLNNKDKSKYKTGDGRTITDDMRNDLQTGLKNGKFAYAPTTNYVTVGSENDKTGSIDFIGTNNKISGSNNTHNVVIHEGGLMLTSDVMEGGKPKIDPTTNQPFQNAKATPFVVRVSSSISNASSRETNNSIWGDKKKAISNYDAGGNPVSSTSSSYSSED